MVQDYYGKFNYLILNHLEVDLVRPSVKLSSLQHENVELLIDDWSGITKVDNLEWNHLIRNLNMDTCSKIVLMWYQKYMMLRYLD